MKINPATVLIVEDHQDLAVNIGDFLEAGGMTVDFAADGISALQLCSQHNFDAIVLDIMMPGIDGYEVRRRIREECGVATLHERLTNGSGTHLNS